MTQPQAVDERALFLSYLDAQRNHVLGILEGLSEEALRRPVLPSGWSCLGLVHHLALDVERFWFRAVVAGDQAVIDSLADAGNAWQVGLEVTAGEVSDLYRQEVDRANATIAATPLDAAPVWWPDFFGDFRLHTLREVILHVITETAVHAGHLDAVREIIDGRTWMVLTE
ncbi:MAG: DinB family protein [Chloroflexota bacterium]|nr:DinB family protein [Chloroflexota bacterium]